MTFTLATFLLLAVPMPLIIVGTLISYLIHRNAQGDTCSEI